MSLTQSSQPGPTQSTSVVKPPVSRANPAGVESPARPRRRRALEMPFGDQIDYRDHPCEAQALAHPKEQV